MLPSAHPSAQPKWHLDRFNRFCASHVKVGTYSSPSKLPLPMTGSGPHLIHDSLGPWSRKPKRHLACFSRFCIVHRRVSLYCTTGRIETSLGACRKCICRLPGLSGSPAVNPTPVGQPRRKPAGQMYSASGAVRSAVAYQQIGDDAVTRRRRLVGRRRAGTAALAM